MKLAHTVLMQCRLCGESDLMLEAADVHDFEYGTAGSFAYYRCGRCEVLNIHPVPDDAKLNEAYPETYHAYHEHRSPVARFLKRRFWSNKVARYAHYVISTSRVLEAGCAFGDLLWAFQKRGILNVQGLDLNAKVVVKARLRGLAVSQGELETADLPDASFDMIVMENFIEHVHDPVKTFHRCHQLLKAGGYLVGETPNTEAWDFKLFGRHWGGYHSPRHLHIFSASSLMLLGAQTGFEVVSVSNLFQPAHWVLSLQNRLQDSPFKIRLKNGRSFYFASLLLLAIPLSLIQLLVSRTSSVEFVFRKGLQPA